jgi:hypothetical protein
LQPLQCMCEEHEIGALQAQRGRPWVRPTAACRSRDGDAHRERHAAARREPGSPAYCSTLYAESRSTMKISGEFGGILGGRPGLP